MAEVLKELFGELTKIIFAPAKAILDAVVNFLLSLDLPLLGAALFVAFYVMLSAKSALVYTPVIVVFIIFYKWYKARQTPSQ